MLLGRVFGHEQHEYLADGLAIGRLTRNRLARPHECAQRMAESLDPPMRHRDALAKAGRTELFTRKQAVEDHRACNLRLIFEKLTDLLEKALFARRFEVEQDVRFRKQLRDVVHE